ncbi:hypothetical protein SGFS_002920 [Streptomyces graminofaciens]|uniref:Uncharacterized protein n=1 Tax=Streptomyces graminofaciens TaxID=68212 RepID=A0ABN5V7N7_9ACTN|nr:hypothetical protein [Streptomyces graminofaciens]BBC29001.1 hypothetical protein SGFS_002920 [Streptomyces graminofaciens]
MDVGSVLGNMGRVAAGVGRILWAVMTAPTTGTEDDARDEIGRLAQKIEDEVPEELRDRAWGLVLTALYDVPREIEQLVQEHQVPDDEEPPAT